MATYSLISQFSRLCVRNNFQNCVRTFTCSTYPLHFKVTQELYGEPLKKKKKIDPQILKNREERRKKKIEKQIKRLEKNARQLKPLEELEVPLTLLDEKKKRLRVLPQLSTEVMEQRALLQKQWARLCISEHLADVREADRLVAAQQRALDVLRGESEQLYQEAIMNPISIDQAKDVNLNLQPDLQLLPFKAKGPNATPPIIGYAAPDGEYIDITKKWDN